MKKPGPELGPLASRFFGYIQLKEKDIVRTGELAPVLGITASQERDLLRRLSKSGWIVRLKRGVYLAPRRIPGGGRYSPGIALILEKLMREEKGAYQLCGQTAFNFYDFDDQVPNVTAVYNNRISGIREIGNLAFQFIKVADSRLGSTVEVKAAGGIPVVYPSKARTLMDAVYDWSRFNSLPRGYDWIRKALSKEPELSSELVEVAARFGNQATMRRIGYLMDRLEKASKCTKRLQDCLSDSRALIPWIPGAPAKGPIDRKWGVIVNG
jgi:predicted transcriptional regulator of viral defense system